MTRGTTVTADDDLPVVRITREFAATPTQVFRAHTDPDLYRQWVGPRGLQTTIEQWDCRPGGSWRFSQVANGETHAFRGCFHDVREDDGVIVQTFTFEGFPDSVLLERLVLEDLGSCRTRLTATSLAESFQARDAMVASGMEHGINDGYEKLDDLLSKENSNA